MVCTKPGCLYAQCYICHKQVLEYDHFYGLGETSEEVKRNRCPLYDDTAKRHKEEVATAENKSREQIARVRNATFKA